MIVISLAGCVSAKSQDEKEMHAICGVGKNRPEAVAWQNDMPRTLQGFTMARLTDPRKISPEQKQLMLSGTDTVNECEEAKLAFYRKYDTPNTNLIHQAYLQNEKLLALDAVQTDMTIGNYNEARLRLYQKYLADLSQARQLDWSLLQSGRPLR